MHRTFIALVLSSAIAITGLSASAARADNDDVAKWIAGAAALAIIGAAIADSQKKPKVVYQQPPSHPKPKGHAYGHTPYYQGHTHGHAGGTVYQPYHNPKALPASCRVTEYMHGHKIRGFSSRCLKRKQVDLHDLPRDCALKIRDPQTGKRRMIFTGRCLRQNGYTLARAY